MLEFAYHRYERLSHLLLLFLHHLHYDHSLFPLETNYFGLAVSSQPSLTGLPRSLRIVVLGGSLIHQTYDIDRLGAMTTRMS